MMMRNNPQRLDKLGVPYLHKEVDETYRVVLFQSLPNNHCYWSVYWGGGG